MKKIEEEYREKCERLIKRDTPMVIIENNNGYVGTCPNCQWNLEWAENIRSDYSFCPNCGQRLWWEEPK